MNDEMRAIESMVIVGVLKYTAAGTNPAGFAVTLRCRAFKDPGACGKKCEGPVRLNLTTRTTLLDCLTELRRKLQEEHGSCISVVNEHAEIMQDNAPAASQDALRTMMHLSEARKCLQKATLEWKNVKERADKINKEALQLQKLVEQAEQEVQKLQARLHAKRARTEAQEEEEQDDIEVGDWTLAKHRSEATRVQNLRNVKLGSRDNAPTYRTGSAGFLRHPRHGLIGSIAYWSRGHIDTAIRMIVQLIVQLDMNERVQEALPSTTDRREAETNAKIVDLFVAAMCEPKKCKSEQQRKEYLIGLAYVMPPRLQEGERGWIRRICDRLDVQRGKRSSSLGARARASDQAVDRRAEFDQDIQKQFEPLKEGDTALSDGYECEITQIGGNQDGLGGIWVPWTWERTMGWARGYGEEQGHKGHHGS